MPEDPPLYLATLATLDEDRATLLDDALTNTHADRVDLILNDATASL